jgi:hypothetical protein
MRFGRKVKVRAKAVADRHRAGAIRVAIRLRRISSRGVAAASRLDTAGAVDDPPFLSGDTQAVAKQPFAGSPEFDERGFRRFP